MSELAKALKAAREACPPTVYKGGYNQAQRYQYVGHEQVLTSGARKALLDNGLVLTQTRVEFLGQLEYETRNGKQLCWRWRGDFELQHVSGEAKGYSFEATTGPNDKAAFVASTALDRTAHMRLLEIAGTNDENPEHDSHDEPKETPKSTAPLASATSAEPRRDNAGMASPRSASQTQPSTSHDTSPHEEPVTQQQITQIQGLYAQLGVTQKPGMAELAKRFAGVSSASELTFATAKKLIAGLTHEAATKKGGK